MARSPQPLKRILAVDPTFAGWDERRRRESTLTAVVRRHLPRTLGERVRVADAVPPELVLSADSGAVAAVARQRSPDLLEELRREGYEFTSIRVRVQVRTTAPERVKVVSKQIDRNDLRPLETLAGGLPEGPLRAALKRFLRRAG